MSFNKTIELIRNLEPLEFAKLSAMEKERLISHVKALDVNNSSMQEFDKCIDRIFRELKAPCYLEIRMQLSTDIYNILQKLPERIWSDYDVNNDLLYDPDPESEVDLDLKAKKLSLLYVKMDSDINYENIASPWFVRLNFFHHFSKLIDVIENNTDTFLVYSTQVLAAEIQEPEAELLIKKLLLNKRIENFNKNLKILEGINNPHLKSALKKHADKIEIRKKYPHAIALFAAATSIEQNSAQEFNECLIQSVSVLKSESEKDQLIQELVAIVQECSDFGLKIRKLGFISKNLIKQFAENKDIVIFGKAVNFFEWLVLFVPALSASPIKANLQINPDEIAQEIKKTEVLLIQNLLTTNQIVIFFEKLSILKKINSSHIQVALKENAVKINLAKIKLHQNAIETAKKALKALSVTAVAPATDSKQALPADTKKSSDSDAAIQAVKQAAASLEPDSAQEFNRCLIHALFILGSNDLEVKQLVEVLIGILQNCSESNLKVRKMGFMEQNIRPGLLGDIRSLALFGLFINYYSLPFDAKAESQHLSKEVKIFLLMQDLLSTKHVAIFNEKLKVLNAIKDPDIQAALKKNLAVIDATEKLLAAIEAVKLAAKNPQSNSAPEFNECLIHALSLLDSQDEQDKLIKELIAIVRQCSDFGLKIRKMGFIKSVAVVAELSVNIVEDGKLLDFGFLINILEDDKYSRVDISLLNNNIMLNLFFTRPIKVFNEKLQLLREINDPRIKTALEIGANQIQRMVKFFIEFEQKPSSKEKITQLQPEHIKIAVVYMIEILKFAADKPDSEQALQKCFDRLYAFFKKTVQDEEVIELHDEMLRWCCDEIKKLERVFKIYERPFDATEILARLTAPQVTAVIPDNKSSEKQDHTSRETTGGSAGLPAVANLTGVGFLHQNAPTAAAGTAANAAAGAPQSGSANTLVPK